MRSLHTRLVRALIPTLALVLVAGGATMYGIIGHLLERELDRALFRDLRNATPRFVIELWLRQGGELAGAGLSDPGLLRGVWLQTWDTEGRTVFRSRHLEDESLPRLARDLEPTPLVDPDADRAVFRDLRLADGTDVRAIAARIRVPARHALRFEPRTATDNQIMEVVLAHDRDSVDQPLTTFLWLMLAVGAGCLGVAAFTATRVVRSGLQPLDELRTQIESMDHDRLDHEIRLDDAPSELAPVRDQLNALILRIRDAFEQEQDFAASAAHELRTPIAGLRATIEVALQKERPAADYREDLERCHEVALQMQTTVEALLELVREQPDRPVQNLVLYELLERCRCSLADIPGDDSRAARVQISRPEDEVELRTSSDLLERVVTNVFHNAIEHGACGSMVDVEYERVRDRVMIETRNTVESPPEDLEERAFDAFWRADKARSDQRHVGLGLRLSRTLIERLGGTITLQVRREPASKTKTRTVTVRITIPC